MADWTEILKKPLISIPKQKIRIKKPKKIEQEDDCKRKLKEIAQRMLNAPLFDMEFTFNEQEWACSTRPSGEEPMKEITEGPHGAKLKVGTWLPEELRGNATRGAIGYLRGAGSDADINELPEKVCCEALKHLKAVSDGVVLSEQTVVGWTVGSRFKLEKYGKNPTVYLWNKEVYIKNAQGPTPLLSIGISLKFFVPKERDLEEWLGVPKSSQESDNWSEVTRGFQEIEMMFKEAVG